MEKGSSPSSSSSSSANGFNFGNKIYFEGGGAPPSPAMKGRSPPRCQVEGCSVDLSDAKAYYSRHKVCGMHSKYPKVIVAGLEQRFCQQCSRFHLLPEFDQGKRSCRRRLAGHNERRRKPTPGSVLSRNLCPSMIGHNSNAEGFVIDFSSAYPSFTGSPSSSERGFGNQLPWQRYNNSQDSLSTPRPADCFNGVVDSTNALSLLSNQPWAPKTRASGLGVNSLLGTNGAAMAQPQVNPGATIGSFGCSSWCLKDDQGDSSLHEMPPDHGLGQLSHPNNSHYISLSPPEPNEGQFHELDHPRAYDSPVQHMHWLL